MRCATSILALVAVLLSASMVHAQYVPIPNEQSGPLCPNSIDQCSGFKVRSDINKKFSALGTSDCQWTANGSFQCTKVNGAAIATGFATGLTALNAIPITQVQPTNGQCLQYQAATNSFIFAACANGSGNAGGMAGQVQYNGSPALMGATGLTINSGTGNVSRLTASGPISITGTQTTGADQISSVNLNGTFNPVTFGADPTGVADSAPAFQAAINAACVAAGSGRGGAGGPGKLPSVSIPAGIYLWNEPVWSNCTPNPNIIIRGAGEYATSINVSFQGVALEASPTAVVTTGGPVLVTSLASGSGNALHVVNNSTAGHVDLDYVLPLNQSTSPYSGPFSGLSAFDFRTYFKIANVTPGVPAQNDFLWSSEGAMNAGGTCLVQGTCTNGIWVNMTTGVLYGGLTIGGTYYQVNSGATTVASGECYETELSYDGAHLNLYLGTNGTGSCASNPGTVTRVGQTAATGTVTQAGDEANVLFADFNQFIYQGQVGGGVDREITMDSIQFSKVARNTAASYTQDTTKFSTDSNTLFLWNFDKTATFAGNAPFALVDTPSNSYAVWQNDGFGCCGGTQEISDLGLFSLNGASAGAGIFANATILKAHDIWTQLFTDGVATSRNATYGSYMRQIDTFAALRYGVAMLGGIGTIDTSSSLGSFVPFVFNGVTARNLLVTPNANTYCGVGMLDNVIVDNSIWDSENAGTFWAACVISGINHYAAITHSVLEPEGSKPPIAFMNSSTTGYTVDLDIDNNTLYMNGATNLIDLNSLTSLPGGINVANNMCNVSNVYQSCAAATSILNPAQALVPYCLSDAGGSSCFGPSTTLPTCGSTNSHLKITLTDASTSCINGQPIAGGGTGLCDAYCDGSSTWRYVGELGKMTNITANDNGVFQPYATTFIDNHITPASSAACTTSGGDLVCTVPGTTANNDGLLVCIASDVNGSYATPSGWTAQSPAASILRSQCYSRVSSGSEAGTPYTWVHTGSPIGVGQITDYQGTNSSTLVDVEGHSVGSTNAMTAPSISTASAGELLVTTFAYGGNLSIPPPNQTVHQRVNATLNASGNFILAGGYVGEEGLPASGATGTRAATQVNTAFAPPLTANYAATSLALESNGGTGSTHPIDWSLGNTQFRTLTDSVTYTFANVPSSATQPQYLNVRTCEDSTGGRTVTWPSVKWPGGSPPSMTTTANYCTIWQFEADNSNVYGSQVADAVH